MDITEVKVFPVDEDKLKAYITIVLDNCFVVRDLKIISGTAGLFVAINGAVSTVSSLRLDTHYVLAELPAYPVRRAFGI